MALSNFASFQSAIDVQIENEFILKKQDRLNHRTLVRARRNIACFDARCHQAIANRKLLLTAFAPLNILVFIIFAHVKKVKFVVSINVTHRLHNERLDLTVLFVNLCGHKLRDPAL